MTGADQLVGLVPAAGRATRLQPLTGSKEALEIRGRPLMCFLLERMRLAGCTRIRVITRPEKQDVVEIADREGLEVVLGRPTSVSESLLAGLDGVPDTWVALVGFPDTLWEPADGFLRLLDEIRRGDDIVVGLFAVAEPERCDVVEVSPSGYVQGVSVKPDAPSADLTWGILAARVGVLRGLAAWDEPGRFLDVLARSRPLRAVLLAGPYEDAGTRTALTRLQADPV